jgi:uncharacterized protein
MAVLTSTAEIRRILEESKAIAVVGANPKPDRPAHFVPKYMKAQGYSIYPINPVHRGKTLFDETVRAELRELDASIDIVNVFRRSRDVAHHLDDILAMKPRPKVVWLQLGIRNDEVARALHEAGIDVVQDRCILIDHRAFL